MFRTVLALVLFLSVTPGTGAAQEPEMSWPDATELLTRERLSAEACTRALKRFLPETDIAARAAAESDYEAARAEFNGLIAKLQVALIENDEDLALETIATRIEQGTTARRSYCAQAEALVPAGPDGDKGVIGDIVAGTIGEVIKAAVAIWSKKEDQDELRRASIRDALDATKWPAFAAVEP